MIELDGLSRAVDTLTEKVNSQEPLDTEHIEKAIQEIRRAIEKLAGIEASLYIRQASQNTWSIKRMEKEYILKVVAECSNNRSQAAKRLGIARNTLWCKLRGFSTDEK